MTKVAWQFLDQQAQKQGISKSELVERYARSLQLDTGKSAEQQEPKEQQRQQFAAANQGTESALRDTLQKLTFHVENTPLAVVEWNRDLQVTRWSQAAEAIFGWSANQVLGSHLNSWQFIYEDDTEAVNGVIGRLLNGTERRNVSSNRNYKADGSVADCEWYNSALLDESGNFVSVLSLVLDVTEHQQAQLALRQSEERYRSLVTASAQWVWHTNPQGEALAAPTNWQTLTGRSDCEWRNWEWLNSLHPDDRERTAELWKTAIQTKSLYETKYQVRTQDGTYRDFYVRGVPVIEADGCLREWVGTCTDITQQKRAEKELQQRTAELAASQFQMQAILDNTPAIIYIIGIDGRMQFANAEWYRLFGAVYGNPIVGRYLTEYLTPEHAETFFQENQLMVAQERVMTFENDVTLPDGLHTFLRTKFPLRDAASQIYAFCGVSLDITERKQMETALRNSEQQLRSVVDNAPLGLYTTGTQGCEFINQYWLSRTGLSLEEALGTGWMQAIYPLDREWVAQEATAAKNASRKLEVEYRFLERDGKIYWVLDLAVPIRDQTNQVQFYQGFLVDITERKQVEEELRKAHNELEMRVRERTAQLEQANLKLRSENTERQRAQAGAKQSEERYRTLIEQAADGIFIADVWGNFLDVNPSCCWMSGYSRAEILGRRVTEMMPSEDLALVPQALSDLQSGRNIISEWRLKRQDGKIIAVEVSAKMLANGQFQAIMRDITQRKQAEEELRHNAFHDPLTDLPNRAFLMERLENAIQQSKRHEDYLFAVLFLDLDRFKVINDSLGHLLGDQLLVAIASKLQACLRLTDTAARLGGDEFTILLEGIKDVSDALRVAERIQMELALPFELEGQEVFTSASIGIALSVTGYERPQDLLRDADTAMYRAKALGKARYEIFNSQMHAQAVERLQLEVDLRNAIERQELCLQYQPIVSLSTGRIVSFEALVRWQHPPHNMVLRAQANLSPSLKKPD